LTTSLALIAENLCIERGGRLVLDCVSIAVQAGEALVVTGPNGAGKTTFLRAIAGFLRPLTGHVTLIGGDPEHDLAQQCHYAGHLDAVKSRLTVTENLGFWANYLGGDGASVDAALKTLGLIDLAEVTAAYLSAGQRRRLGLARLLVAHRPVWLLDEPTVSLDQDSTAAFVRAIEQHRAGGGIVIAATHVDLGLRDATGLRLGPATRAPA
jgi:heme exporter protein A